MRFARVRRIELQQLGRADEAATLCITFLASGAHVRVTPLTSSPVLTINPPSTDVAPESQLATKLRTSPGMVMGTVNYMSPEQAMGREVDHRTDIFSLGVVLYEMATGRVPFSGASLTETIDCITHAQPEAIARLNYSIPPELEVIIKKALRKNRDERYQTIRDLVVDLRDLQQELEFQSRMEHSVAPANHPLPALNSDPATQIKSSGRWASLTSERQARTLALPAQSTSLARSRNAKRA